MVFSVDMMQTVVIGLVLAIVIYQSLAQLNIYRVCGHLLLVETLIFKVMLVPFLFMGTYHGMVIGCFASLFLSGMLRFRKHFYGYTKYSFERRRWEFYPSVNDENYEYE